MMTFRCVPAVALSTITVTGQQQHATTLNPVNAAHFLPSRVTFPLALQRDNCRRRDAETGAPQSALEEGEATGKEGPSGRKAIWDVPACLNTVGEKDCSGVQSEDLSLQHLERKSERNKWDKKKQAN